jgi:signal transduction histidine kinase
VFFIFTMLAASYRWRFREAVITALSIGLLLTFEAAAFSVLPEFTALRGAEPDVRQFLTRGAYLVLAGLTLAVLAEGEKKLRAEASTVARIIAKIQPALGLSGSLQIWMHEILRYFRARRAILALREVGTGRMYLWEGSAGRGHRPTALRLSELDTTAADVYFFALPGQTVMASPGWTRKDATSFQVVALDGGGTRVAARTVDLPPEFLAAHPLRSVMALSASFGEEWACRLFLLDPRPYIPPETAVRFLQTLVRQTGPTLYNTYLVRRLRVRAGTLERARVARELHYGVIQSLISVEMQVDVIRRQAVAASAPLTTELSRIQGLLRDQVRDLRDLMDEMKQSGPGPGDLLQYLTNLGEKFQHDTGISVSFISDLREVLLPPRVCRELARIVQEALVNVRKHSEARHVVIRLSSSGSRWTLVVDDDGRGLGFSGRMTHAELDAFRKGPVTIKERVRAIRGELTIDSVPGHGVRLEVSIPHAAHAHYV